MPLVITQKCSGCRRFGETGDFFHEEWEWNEFHKAGWFEGKSDWQPREELKEHLAQLKETWNKVQKLKEVKE